jgi:hypothetical protein
MGNQWAWFLVQGPRSAREASIACHCIKESNGESRLAMADRGGQVTNTASFSKSKHPGISEDDFMEQQKACVDEVTHYFKLQASMSMYHLKKRYPSTTMVDIVPPNPQPRATHNPPPTAWEGVRDWPDDDI